MNKTCKMTTILTPVLLTAMLASCGRTLATTTTPLNVPPANTTGSSAFASKIPDLPQIIAQGSSIRDRGVIHFPSNATSTSVDNFVEGNGILNIQPAGGNSTQIHDRGSIEFLAGGTFASINGHLAAQNIDRYHFEASAGQSINLYIGSPNAQVLLTLIDPNGNPIVRYQSGATSWVGRLPADGVYQVDVVNQSSASSYNLGLSIR
jgi:hypothetical protein